MWAQRASSPPLPGGAGPALRWTRRVQHPPAVRVRAAPGRTGPTWAARDVERRRTAHLCSKTSAAPTGFFGTNRAYVAGSALGHLSTPPARKLGELRGLAGEAIRGGETGPGITPGDQRDGCPEPYRMRGDAVEHQSAISDLQAAIDLQHAGSPPLACPSHRGARPKVARRSGRLRRGARPGRPPVDCPPCAMRGDTWGGTAAS